MSEPRTPQVPMVDGNGEPFYPLTQYNQIVMPDGSRWDGKGGGAQIDDTSASTEKVYSSQKTQYELDQLSEQIPDPYTLPNASSSVLGGVKVGNGLTIDSNGVLSLNVSNASGVSF